jgi:arginine decarboxylase-like protein
VIDVVDTLRERSDAGLLDCALHLGLGENIREIRDAVKEASRF